MDLSMVTFAFMAGLFAFLAPCSFPMLPSYVAYFLGFDEEKEENEEKGVIRSGLTGLYFGSLTTLGFLVFFALIGFLLLPVSPLIRTNLAVVSGLVASALVILGLLMLAGKDPYMTLPVKAPEKRGAINFFLFGILYAAASLGCSLPMFISVVLAAFNLGGAGGSLFILTVYAAGMGSLMIPIAVATSVSKDVLIEKLRANVGLIKKIGAVILILMGIYIFLLDVLHL